MAEPMELIEVRRIAAEVVQQLNANLDVVASLRSEQSTSYSEVLLTVRGCAREPCRVVVSVRRDEPEPVVRAALTDALQKHLRQHGRA
jgi:hypothetical protein